jgi:UTP--glucose-1-phosphate uridylyltransferase
LSVKLLVIEFKFGELDAYRFNGRRYDCGSKLGFLECTMAGALKHPDFGPRARVLMQSMHDGNS